MYRGAFVVPSRRPFSIKKLLKLRQLYHREAPFLYHRTPVHFYMPEPSEFHLRRYQWVNSMCYVIIFLLCFDLSQDNRKHARHKITIQLVVGF